MGPDRGRAGVKGYSCPGNDLPRDSLVNMIAAAPRRVGRLFEIGVSVLAYLETLAREGSSEAFERVRKLGTVGGCGIRAELREARSPSAVVLA